MYCHAFWPSAVECGSESNIDLCCTVRRGGKGKSNPKRGGKLTSSLDFAKVSS